MAYDPVLDYLQRSDRPSPDAGRYDPVLDYLGTHGPSEVLSIEDDDEGLRTPISEFSKGLWGSLTSGNMEMMGGAAEALSVVSGRDPTTSFGRQMQTRAVEMRDRQSAPLTWEEATEGGFLSDIAGGVNYLSGLTGQAVGSMAGPLAAGAVGAAAGSAVAPGPGTVAGGIAGAFSTGAMLNIGETYLQLRNEGVDPKQAAKWAIPVGSGIGVIDTVGLSRVVGATVVKPIKKKAIAAFVREAGKGYARGATEEGLTEMAQSAIREGVVATLTGNPDLQRRALSAVQEGFAGALGGGFIGGVGRAGRAALWPQGRPPTLSETSSGQSEAPGELLDGDGGPMDELVKEGFKVTQELLGDEESNTRLGEQGLPAIGTDVTLTDPSNIVRSGLVKGIIAGTEGQPDRAVITAADGKEHVVDIPGAEGQSIQPTEQYEAQRETDAFVESVGQVTDRLGDDQVAAVLQEQGATTITGLPAEKRQEFIGKLNEMATQADERQAEQDASLLFDEQVKDLGEQSPTGTDFATLETGVRGQMGLGSGPIPGPRRKSYLSLVKMQTARAQKEAAAAEKTKGDGTKAAPATPQGEQTPTIGETGPKGIPSRVQRFEESGVETSGPDKPHGLYTTPSDAESPHGDLGGDRVNYDVNPQAKVLSIEEFPDSEISMRRGASGAGSGVHVARHLLGPDEFNRLKTLGKSELLAEAEKIDGSVEWGNYYDSQEIMEGIGGVLARREGYDAVWIPDQADSKFSEFVALTSNAFTTPTAQEGQPAGPTGQTGRETILRVPSGTEHRARYRVVEASSLTPSHNPQTFGKNEAYPEGVQERSYHSSKDAQIAVIQNAQDLKPDLVINTDPTALTGPPQVTPSGIVIGGNSRTMSLQRAYQEGGADSYKQELSDRASEFGLAPDQVAGMSEPVLVREFTDVTDNPEGMRRIGADLNAPFAKSKSDVETAISAGKNLSVDTAERIAARVDEVGPDTTLRKLMDDDPKLFLDSLLADGVISEIDLPKYRTNLGKITPAGKEFIENAMVGSIIRDADLLQSLPASLVQKMERIVPPMAALQAREDAWNIADDVREATRQLVKAQASAMPLADYFRQTGMFEEPASPQVQALATVLDKKPTEVTKAFRAFAREAKVDVPGQEALFGTPDPVETFARVFGLEPSSSGGGVFAMASDDRPTLPSLAEAMEADVRPALPKAVVRKSAILKDISAHMDNLSIRIGRISQRAHGIYKVQSEAIRIRRANDIPVAAHELGHHINKLMWGGEKGKLNYDALRPFSDELAPIATKPAKGQSALPEGFAEYIRLYLTRPAEAKAKAPTFHAEFAKQLEAHPKIATLLASVQDQVRRYVEQPAASKVLSKINTEHTKKSVRESFDKLYTHTVDALHPIKQAVDGMANRSNQQTPITEDNAYRISRLLAGWLGKANHFIDLGTFNPKTDDVNGKSLKAILKPVDEKHDDLKVYLVAKRALEKGKQGIETGIEAAEATAAIAQVETPAIAKAAEELYAYQDAVLRYLVERGHIGEDQYAQFKALNEDYVPFYRAMEGGENKQGGSGKTMSDLWNPVKRMKGSTRDIMDPLESILKNTYTFINLAERNRVGQILADQAEASEGSAPWVEAVPPKMQPTAVPLESVKKSLEAAGVDVKALDPKVFETVATVFNPVLRGSPQENIISVFRDGKRKLYQIDKTLYGAMQSLDAENSNMVVNILSKPARILRAGATSLSPDFLSRNPFRDAFTAFMQSRNGFKPGVDTYRGLFEVVKGRGDPESLYAEWLRAGGDQAALVSMDRTTLQQSLNDLMASPMKMAVRHPVEALRIFSEYGELATRMGEYRLARKKGKSPEEAAFDARDSTLDFARVGASTRALNMIVAFWNASVQGTDRFVQVHREHPKQTIIRGTVGMTIPTILLYGLNHDDEDWNELPRWQRDFFWMIPTKGTPLYEHTRFIPVPKPFLWGVIYSSAPERILDWIKTKDASAFDNLAKSIKESALPNFVPTAMVSVMEWWANKSLFTGRPVVPQHLENLPAKHQALPWTSEFSKGMAKMFTEVGMEVSPIKLDQAIFGVTAGAGRAVLKATDPILRDADAPEKPSGSMADIPGLRAFAVRFPTGSAESLQKFYTQLEELDRKHAAQTHARKTPGVDADRMTPAEMRARNILRKSRTRLQNLSSAGRRAEASDTLTGAEKRTRLDDLAQRKLDISKRALAIVQ